MNDYYSVIISFNPDTDRLKDNVNNLRQQGFNILVVDNGSEEPPFMVLQKNELFRLGENKGIAAALNIGMEEAKKRGAKWVLSLDQDTEIADNLLEEYKKHLGLPRLGALCPKVIRRGEESKETAVIHEKITKCPTSGFFTSIEMWENSGKYDDWMFIDYVDYDLCMKINLSGYTIYRINTTYIIQELGRLYINPVFNKVGEVLNIKKIRNFARVYNHSPFRNYYFVRNSLYFQYKYSEYLDMRYEKSHLFRWEAKKILLEKHRLENIKALFRGVRDFHIKKRQMQNAK